jgi:hypothetical protein
MQANLDGNEIEHELNTTCDLNNIGGRQNL